MENQIEHSSDYANKDLTAQQVVRAALGLVCAHHESQLSKFTDILDGKKPSQFNKMMNLYHQCMENNLDREDAFIELLRRLEGN